MRDLDPVREQEFFDIFREYFDLEKDAAAQHDSGNYTLDRMAPLAALAGNPERRLAIIHVAGTKGKGSTCYYIAALLKAAGKRCGIFTSPHVDTVRERFQLDGELMDYETLCEAAKEYCAALKGAALKPSLFEIFTVLAMKLFADAGVDYAVMETGIGGRVDATNYVPAKALELVTPVSFDHMALLGDTIEAIAGEKAGIITCAQAPLVLSRQPYPAAEAILRQRAEAVGCRRIIAPDESIDTDQWLAAGTPEFLRDNFRSALTAVHALGLSPSPADFHAPKLRARFELLRQEPPVVIDAAHTGDSAQKLARAVMKRFPGRHFTCVLGCLDGKDIRGIVNGLGQMDASYILVNPKSCRASARDALLAECRAAGLHVTAVLDSLDSRSQLPQNEPLLFTGSFFTALIGDMLFASRP